MRSWFHMTFAEAAAAFQVPFAVAMAADANNTFLTEINGPVDAGDIFAIASMTKAITAAAALQLVEQGALELDRPVDNHLPALRDLRVIDGFNSANEPIFSTARYQVTLRQLLTHTAGFAYPWNHPLARKLGAAAPPYLIFPPGSGWHYGVNIDWVGRLIEVVSGESLEAYFQRNILIPLGMHDTSFLLQPEKFSRLVRNYQRDGGGILQQLPKTQPPAPPSYNGGGGLFSTAPDYIRFLQMILRGGLTATGQRILSERSIAAMLSNQTGNLAAGRIQTTMPERSCNVDLHPGAEDQFTLAFLRNPLPHPGGRSAGSLSWGGIRNTFYWIDPTRGIAATLLMQFQPFCDPAAMGLLTHFEHTLYKAL